MLAIDRGTVKGRAIIRNAPMRFAAARGSTREHTVGDDPLTYLSTRLAALAAQFELRPSSPMGERDEKIEFFQIPFLQ